MMNTHLKTEVTTTITWSQAVHAVVDIVEKCPHFGPEFALYDAERLERAARLIREAIQRGKQ